MKTHLLFSAQISALLVTFALATTSLAVEDMQGIQDMQEILADPVAKTFSLHNPSYILVGHEDLKLQFSAKYRFKKNLRLFLGYTQTMFWNIYDESKPFRDINFRPELFYRFLIGREGVISADVGYYHASNGKGGLESRSLDQAFFEVRRHVKLWGRPVLLGFRGYATFNEDEVNENIEEHIGYYQLGFVFPNLLLDKEKELDIGLTLRAGDELVDFHRGAMELNIRFSSGSKTFNPDFMLQYYWGYVENLLEFEQRESRLRGGLLFYF